jgi:hypothetical protein
MSQRAVRARHRNRIVGAIVAFVAVATALAGLGRLAVEGPHPMALEDLAGDIRALRSIASEMALMTQMLDAGRLTHHYAAAHSLQLQKSLDEHRESLERPVPPSASVSGLRARELGRELDDLFVAYQRGFTDPAERARIRGRNERIGAEAAALDPAP